jgi:hypothetical protein
MKVLILSLLLLSPCWSWSFSRQPSVGGATTTASTRREALLASVSSLVAGVVVASPIPPPALALEGVEKKQVGISNEDLGKIITTDIQKNQFMVAADITRSVYDESATFTDEIDTYQMDQWIRGTKRLFVADKSHVDIVPNTLQVTDTGATFRFTEDLMFNIPLLRPTVYLSGLVELKRDPNTGLIISYREKWDQDINTVLRSAKFGNI